VPERTKDQHWVAQYWRTILVFSSGFGILLALAALANGLWLHVDQRPQVRTWGAAAALAVVAGTAMAALILALRLLRIFANRRTAQQVLARRRGER